MARKDLPWQAEFTEQDRDLIVGWVQEKFSPWDRWGRPLAELGTPAHFFIHQPGWDTSAIVCENVDRTLDPTKARRMLRTLGFNNVLIEAYLTALRIANANRSEDEIFANLWLNLSGAGAATHLQEILTADKENAERWNSYLRAERKTWGDVKLSDRAKAKIADEIIGGLTRIQEFPAKNAEALRARFKRYTKRYLGSPIRT